MRVVLIISLLFLATTSWSQKLIASVDKDKILIGESFTLRYAIETKKGDKIQFKALKEKMPSITTDEQGADVVGPDFELLTNFKSTQKDTLGTRIWTGEYKATIWDSGMFLIPGQSVLINDSVYHFESIDLYANFMNSVKGVDIYDIKENFAELPSEPFSVTKFLKKYWLLILALVLSLTIWQLIRFLKRRRKREPEIFKAMSLKERTLMAIDALEREKLWEKDKLKEHFVELSYILRSYLTSRYDISVLEKTSYETKILLTKKGLNDDTVDSVGNILSQSDMVKFAKSKPEAIEILRVSTLAKQIVAETSPLEFDNVE